MFLVTAIFFSVRDIFLRSIFFLNNQNWFVMCSCQPMRRPGMIFSVISVHVNMDCLEKCWATSGCDVRERLCGAENIAIRFAFWRALTVLYIVTKVRLEWNTAQDFCVMKDYTESSVHCMHVVDRIQFLVFVFFFHMPHTLLSAMNEELLFFVDLVLGTPKKYSDLFSSLYWFSSASLCKLRNFEGITGSIWMWICTDLCKNVCYNGRGGKG
jgi:hypothetical protein